MVVPKRLCSTCVYRDVDVDRSPCCRCLSGEIGFRAYWRQRNGYDDRSREQDEAPRNDPLDFCDRSKSEDVLDRYDVDQGTSADSSEPKQSDTSKPARDESRDVCVYDDGDTLGCVYWEDYANNTGLWSVEVERYVPYSSIASESSKPALRPEVLWFARQMEAKLRENDHKGHWIDCGNAYLQRRIREEALELEHAIENAGSPPWEADNPLRVAIVREAADVANFAMMVADNWRGCVINRVAEASGTAEKPREVTCALSEIEQIALKFLTEYTLWSDTGHCSHDLIELSEQLRTALAKRGAL